MLSKAKVIWLILLAIIGSSFILREGLAIIFPTRNDPKFAPKSDYGLVLSDHSNPIVAGPGVDIVFVHGLGSNPDTTWLSRNQSYACNFNEDNYVDDFCHNNAGKEYVNWATDLFYNELPPNDQERTRLFFYNYDSYWMRDGIEERRARLGQELFEQVADNCAKDPDRQLVFVAHSYGGLVVKEALMAARTFKKRRPIDVFKQTRAIIFLGTPHRGSRESEIGLKLARMLKFFGLGATPEILEAITYDSSELRDMHRRFEAILEDTFVVNFFETIKLSNLGGLYKIFAVDEASATLDRPTWQNIPLHTNHTSLNKFYRRDSQYKRVSGKLKYIVESILKKERSERAVYEVPRIPNKEYVDRRELSLQIERNLEKPGGMVAVVGMGGIGKTQLALRYAENYKDRYKITLWIDVTSKETALYSFHRIAQALKKLVPEFSITDEESLGTNEDLGFMNTVYKVRDWLQTRDKRYGEILLIFDNMDEFSMRIEDLVPLELHGSVIITSRNMQSSIILPKKTRFIKVGDMAPDEAESLLFKHLKLPEVTEAPTIIWDLLRQICEAMRWSPLAIHLAGAQLALDSPAGQQPSLSKTEELLKRFLRDIESHEDEILEAETIKGMTPYEFTSHTALDSSLEAIDKHFPKVNSRLFLEFLASTEMAEIPIKVFELMAKDLGEMGNKVPWEVPSWFKDLFPMDIIRHEWDDFKFRQTLRPLERYGLVEYSRDERNIYIYIHPLVRWKARRDGRKRTNISYDAIHAGLS